MLPMLMAACCEKKQYHQWFSGLSNLHTVQEMEAREALYTAYEQSTYTKIPEFVDFIHLLRDSAAHALHLAEADLLELTEQCVQQKVGSNVQLTANLQSAVDSEVVNSKPVKLMETLCSMLVKKIGANQIVDAISIRIEKPDAPFPHPGGLAVVEHEWTRD